MTHSPHISSTRRRLLEERAEQPDCYHTPAEQLRGNGRSEQPEVIAEALAKMNEARAKFGEPRGRLAREAAEIIRKEAA